MCTVVRHEIAAAMALVRLHVRPAQKLEITLTRTRSMLAGSVAS